MNKLLILLFLSSGAFAQTFTDVTTASVPIFGAVSKTFGVNMPDVNVDGCFDAFVVSHTDDSASALYVQDKSEGVCVGSFRFIPPTAANYSQPLPASLSISGRVHFNNITNNALGLPSIWGQHTGGLIASKYAIDGSAIAGGDPTYQTKSKGCPSAKEFCIAAPILSGSSLQWVEFGSMLGSLPAAVTIANISTSAVIANSAAVPNTNILAVLDVDPFGTNSQPEILDFKSGGFWRWSGSSLVFTASTLPTIASAESPTHMGFGDFDNDGDTDIVYIKTTAASGSVATPYLLRNDGSGAFTSVLGAFPAISQTAYWSSYGNVSVADLNLDSWPDIIYCAPNLTTALVLLNSGGVFTSGANITQSFASATGKPFCGVGDFDNDGKIDVIKTALAPKNFGLFRNTTATSNHWIRFRLRGNGANSDGLGAQIVLRDPETGSVVGSVQVTQDQMIPHFGVAGHSSVDVEFIFPHDITPSLVTNVLTDKDYVINQDSLTIDVYAPGSAIPR